MDIVFFKGPQWDRTGYMDTDLFTKPSNMHLFFTFKSEHPAACKRGVILSELSRFLKRCSTESAYLRHTGDYWLQLRRRGFPTDYLADTFDAAPPFRERSSLLYRPAASSDSDTQRPHCLITDYSYVKHKMRLSEILHQASSLLPQRLQSSRRLIAWRSAPKLRNLVTFRFYNNFIPSPDGGLEDPTTSAQSTDNDTLPSS